MGSRDMTVSRYGANCILDSWADGGPAFGDAGELEEQRLILGENIARLMGWV